MKLQKYRSGKPRPPLRTMAELAEEFGVSTNILGRLLAEPDAPKCRISNMTSNASELRKKWYEPKEVRAWWARREYLPSDRAEYSREYYERTKEQQKAKRACKKEPV